MIDSECELKAAAYELRRLYAPALVSLEKLADRVRAWVVLDNAGAPLAAELTLEARSLVDGSLLARKLGSAQIAVGERCVVLEMETGGFDPETTLLLAELSGVSTFRLLAEPKQARFATPELLASIEGNELSIQSDLPVVDLYLWDAEAELSLSDNFVTLAGGGARRRIGFRGTPRRLSARSLAGRHTLRFA